MSAFSILGLTGGAATGGGEWDIQLIALDDIIPAKNNNYGIRDIEPLAESIQADGLLSPLNVRFMEDTGKYEIISGERRYTAIKHLRDSGVAGHDAAPCLVERDVSDLKAEIRLIRANSTTRVQTDPERVKNAARLAVLIDQLKGKGVKVPGRKRENIAEALGTSTAQVGRMESIEKNLIPEAKEAFERGGLNFSTAYETSLLPPEKQVEVVQGLKSGEKVDIKSVKERRRPPAAPTVYAPEPPPLPPFAPGAPVDKAKSITHTPEPPGLPRVHKLKTWEGMFDAIAEGLKPWEYRLNDRDYKQGDILHLMRYNHVAGEFTGQTLDMVVTFIMHGPAFNIPAGYVIMSIKEAGASGGYETA